jgi:hypothetical protein
MVSRGYVQIFFAALLALIAAMFVIALFVFFSAERMQNQE